MEANNLQISEMTIDDLPDVHRIERHSYATPWSYQTFVSELDNNDCGYYLVVRNQGEIIGYIGMWIILNEGHITNVAVHQDWRGLGVGKKLLTAIESYGQKRGVVKTTLEVRVSNDRAKSLYQKLGYRSYGIRPRYYLDNNEDALIMWKDLTKDEWDRKTNFRD